MSNCTIQCPYCNSSVDVIMAIEVLTGNEWTELLQGIPLSMVGVLLRYLELFKPLKQDLRWSRRLNLTKELIPMIKAAQVKRNGIVYAAPLPVWESAMLKMAARPPTLTLPLTGHGYLLKMLANQGEQNAAALEKAAEQQRQNRVVYADSNNGLPPVDKNHADNLMAEAERKRQERNKPPDGWKGALRKTP
ncbi:MAG: hypothetical protein ACXWT1_05730 [Methylobacter sp.]